MPFKNRPSYDTETETKYISDSSNRGKNNAVLDFDNLQRKVWKDIVEELKYSWDACTYVLYTRYTGRSLYIH